MSHFECLLQGCEKEAVSDPNSPLYHCCSLEHKEKWADQTYGKRGQKKQGHSVEYMQKRLLELGEEARLKAKKTLFD